MIYSCKHTCILYVTGRGLGLGKESEALVQGISGTSACKKARTLIQAQLVTNTYMYACAT